MWSGGINLSVNGIITIYKYTQTRLSTKSCPILDERICQTENDNGAIEFMMMVCTISGINSKTDNDKLRLGTKWFPTGRKLSRSVIWEKCSTDEIEVPVSQCCC